MEDEKILYKNETIYNKENLQNFSKFIWLQYNKFKYWAIIVFSTLFLIFGMVGGIGQVIRFQRIPVCNTEKYIYIMINKRTGYIIDKSGFNNYIEQDFTDYMKCKFKDKYIDYLDNEKKRSYTVKDIIVCIIVFLIFCGMLMGYIS